MDDDLSVRDPGIDAGAVLGPDDELALAEARFRGAELDEARKMFDPDTQPKPPHDREEAVTSRDGQRTVDVQAESTLADDGAMFDLTADDLLDADLNL